MAIVGEQLSKEITKKIAAHHKAIAILQELQAWVDSGKPCYHPQTSQGNGICLCVCCYAVIHDSGIHGEDNL